MRGKIIQNHVHPSPWIWIATSQVCAKSAVK